MAKVIHRLHVAAALQQHLHCVLTAALTTQNQRRPEGATGRGSEVSPLAKHIEPFCLAFIGWNLYPKLCENVGGHCFHSERSASFQK